MAWQWNPGLPITPDASGMNLGSYTQEQWSLMQQQNWQQWTQWQQQYSQWQTQYGEKYAEQMQVMQAMGMPPLPPANSAPPAPPPPEKPPPPPPHENDQPLYGNPHLKVSPPQSQSHNKASDSNPNVNTGNNQNWSITTASSNDAALALSASAVNSEALKKLAEEEHLFDIQFQKWEEEIQKWKEENVNHPDKQAYSEYEQKFEACRAQLLERRQQMKQKRARLLNNPPNSTNTTNTGNNISSTIPPLLQNANFSKSNANNKSNHQMSQPAQNYHQPTNNKLNHQMSQPAQNYHQPTNNKSNHQMSQPAQNYHQHINNKSNHQMSQPAKNYHQHTNTSQFQHNSMQQDQDYDRNSSKNINPQERFESYDEDMIDDAAEETDNSNFLPTSGSLKGIPGLDLVPDTDKGNKQDVIDITEDKREKMAPAIMGSVAPDYSTISRGINNILGDEKIMNILSMMQSQKPPNVPFQNPQSVSHTNAIAPYAVNSNVMPPGPSPWNRNDNHNSQHNHRPSGNYDNRQPLSGNFDIRPPPSGNYHNRPTPSGNYDDDDRQERNNYDTRQQNSGYGNRHQQDDNFNNTSNIPDNRQNFNFPMNRGPLRPQNYSEPPQNRFDQNYNEGNVGYDKNSQEQYEQFENSNMHPRGITPIRPHGPPPSYINPVPENQNADYPRGFDRIPVQENIRAPAVAPPNPKWVEEPLFMPSIIVEYEHKPLRMKARDFIEPVHTFDYDHKSKDSDVKKMDFEKEVDDLFSRKPRTYEKENDRSKYPRDPYSRDYERRIPEDNTRDDYRQRSFRGEYRDERPRPDDRYMEKRDDRDERPRPDDRYMEKRDDRDVRFSRREETYRERDYDGNNGDRRDNRDVLRDRERDFGRDMDRDKDFGRRRDIGNYRDSGKERDIGRERELGRDRRDTGRDRDRFGERNRSDSRDKDTRKRGPSLDSKVSSASSNKKAKDANDKQPTHVVMIDDLLEPPGREMRPAKILIILRGPPGCGKSYLAKLIRDKEAEYGVIVRILSIDNYFVHEGEIEEKDPATGKTIKKPSLKYEYDEQLEESYNTSLKRAIKRCITDGYFPFIIFDAVNDQLKSYADVWNFARQAGFQVYICTLDLDPQMCYKRNIHNRKLEDIEGICSRFFATPTHHIHLDPTTLLQNAAITEVQMEDVSMEDAQDIEVENSFSSKWERMDDVNQLARLDGISKPLRPSKLSMEDYLQLDEWTPNTAKPGKKTVRWADIEERRQQEKMRAIGFVVGQTDWNRMTDPTLGSSALTQTKYIERVRRN